MNIGNRPTVNGNAVKRFRGSPQDWMGDREAGKETLTVELGAVHSPRAEVCLIVKSLIKADC
jgi:hypothetical protein